MNLLMPIDIYPLFLPKKKINIQNSRSFCLQETCNYFTIIQESLFNIISNLILQSQFLFSKIYVDFCSLSCKHFLQIVNWEPCITQIRVYGESEQGVGNLIEENNHKNVDASKHTSF